MKYEEKIMRLPELPLGTNCLAVVTSRRSLSSYYFIRNGKEEMGGREGKRKGTRQRVGENRANKTTEMERGLIVLDKE